MPFTYFQPDKNLRNYIHSYWTLRGNGSSLDVLYPDTCVDVVANMGKSFYVAQFDVQLEEKAIYLGGAITSAIYEKIPAGVRLLGVRFQPGCFACFYSPHPLGEITDRCLRIGDHFLPPLQRLVDNPVPALDQFFLKKLKQFNNPVKQALDEIFRSKGNCDIDTIALITNRSIRQAERLFKQHTGLTPKQFCKIVQFNHAQLLLESMKSDDTLLNVALEAGYYDHAHFTKVYKKIARHNPSAK